MRQHFCILIPQNVIEVTKTRLKLFQANADHNLRMLQPDVVSTTGALQSGCNISEEKGGKPSSHFEQSPLAFLLFKISEIKLKPGYSATGEHGKHQLVQKRASFHFTFLMLSISLK